MTPTASGIGQVDAQASSDGPTLTQINGQMVSSSVTMDQMFNTKGLNPSTEDANTANEPEAQKVEEQTKPEKNAEAKKDRLSQKEWQDAQEKSKKTEVLEQQTLEAQQEQEKLHARVQKLEEENARKEWEFEHPIVRDARYREQWDNVNNDRRLQDLTYDERWRLISREDASRVSKTLIEDREQNLSSVPYASRGMPQEPQLDQETASLGRFWNNSPEDFKKYGLI